MVHAVIFDIDGTLLDSSAQDEALYRQAVEAVLGKVRFRPGLERYEHVTDAGILLQVFADNALEPDGELILAIKNEFFARLTACVRANGPFAETPGARALLERLLASDRHAVAIATGGWRGSAIIKLASAGFDVDSLPLATSDDALRREDIMQRALHSIGPDAAPVTYFGDGTWDRQACATLGWQFRAVGPILDGLSSFDDEFAA